jgi:hypothetical protein
MAVSSCIPSTSGYYLYRTNHMKLLTTLLATTAIANAGVVFDTRIDLDFNTGPGMPPNVVYDNVGAPITFDFFEFGPKTIFMNVYTEVERSQVVDSIQFSVNKRIPLTSVQWLQGEALDGRGGDGGEVEATVQMFDDRDGRYDISFGLKSPATTDSTSAHHSGGTSFAVEWEFDEPTTAAALADAFFYDGFAQYGIEDMTVRASVIDYSSRGDDVDDITDFSLPWQDSKSLFYLAGTVIPEPSSAMLAFLGLLPILRRNRK